MEIDQIIFETVRAIVAVFVITTLLKNYLFLIISPIYPIVERLRQLKFATRNSEFNHRRNRPRISVIVPAWNEEVGIGRTIQSIVSNGYDNTELIVINDGSTDRTHQVIRNKLAKLQSNPEYKSLRLVYESQENSGKGVALNLGVEKARGDIVMTVDADSILKKGALENLTKYYADPSIMAVVGNVEIANARTFTGLAQRLEYYFGFYNKRAHAVLGAEYIFGGACASFRRGVFDKLGAFDEGNKTEDIEMSMRIREAGYRCTYAEDVVCYTEGASDIRSLISQRVRWKKGRLDTFKKYRRLFFSTEERHNFFLSFFVLPFSLLTEIQLLFEPIAIAILIAYSFMASEFLSLAIGITFIFLVYVAVSIFHSYRPRPILILAFPFTWPIFYVLDWVEWLALLKSINLIIRGKDVKWQKWQRKGIKV